MLRHIAAISELSHEEFQQGSPEIYMNNLNHPYGSALFPSPYDHTAVLTPEWLTLASILHDDNFERSLDHSPHSPSGTANWHHAFQTSDVVHLIPKAVHSGYHGALHPITDNSQIDRQEFSCERLRLNQAWVLLAATRSIAKILLKYSTDDEVTNFLAECSSLYSSNSSSRAISEDPAPAANRALNDEYDDKENDQVMPIAKLSGKSDVKNSAKIKAAKERTTKLKNKKRKGAEKKPKISPKHKLTKAKLAKGVRDNFN